ILPVEVREAANNNEVDFRYQTISSYFSDIPCSPFAYWASETVFNIVNNGLLLTEFVDVRRGMNTSNNNKLIRFRPVITILKMYKGATNHDEALESLVKWFTYSKGGGYRKWYGYFEYVVNWETSGDEIIKFAKTINKSYTRTIVNIGYYFKPSIGFSYI